MQFYWFIRDLGISHLREKNGSVVLTSSEDTKNARGVTVIDLGIDHPKKVCEPYILYSAVHIPYQFSRRLTFSDQMFANPLVFILYDQSLLGRPLDITLLKGGTTIPETIFFKCVQYPVVFGYIAGFFPPGQHVLCFPERHAT